MITYPSSQAKGRVVKESQRKPENRKPRRFWRRKSGDRSSATAGGLLSAVSAKKRETSSRNEPFVHCLAEAGKADSPSALEDVPAKDEAPDIRPEEDADDDVPVKVHGEEHDEVGHRELRRMDESSEGLLRDGQAESSRWVRGRLDKGGDEGRDERSWDRGRCRRRVAAAGRCRGRRRVLDGLVDPIILFPQDLRASLLEVVRILLVLHHLLLLHPSRPLSVGDDDRPVVLALEVLETFEKDDQGDDADA